jgi:hypothetical protein
MEMKAQVRVSLFAHLAAPTGLGRIDGYPHTRRQGLKLSPHGVIPHGLYYGGKLMAQD